MSSLSFAEQHAFEDLFSMETGYVLPPTITDAKFKALVAQKAGRDADSPAYRKYGRSKAKRLRAFWEIEEDKTVAAVLGALFELWEYQNPQPSESKQESAKLCRLAILRLLGKSVSGHASEETTAEQFLDQDFSEIDISTVPIEQSLLPVLQTRLVEANRSFQANCPLATIFLSGSVLEGLLLGVALSEPRRFNQSSVSPKDKEGKVRQFHDWSLAQLIDTSTDLGLISIDVKKFSHALRDFRNYIHPYQQMSSGFTPDTHTARICLQVLKAAIADLSKAR